MANLWLLSRSFVRAILYSRWISTTPPSCTFPAWWIAIYTTAEKRITWREWELNHSLMSRTHSPLYLPYLLGSGTRYHPTGNGTVLKSCNKISTLISHYVQYHSNVSWQSRLKTRFLKFLRIKNQVSRLKRFDFEGSRIEFQGSSFEFRDT